MKRCLFFLLSLCLLTGCASGGEPAPEILTEPPALTVRCADTSAEALRGAASWSYDNGNGTWSSFEADSLHPLDEAARDLTPRLTFSTAAEAPEAVLEWDTPPGHGDGPPLERRSLGDTAPQRRKSPWRTDHRPLGKRQRLRGSGRLVLGGALGRNGPLQLPRRSAA